MATINLVQPRIGKTTDYVTREIGLNRILFHQWDSVLTVGGADPMSVAYYAGNDAPAPFSGRSYIVVRCKMNNIWTVEHSIWLQNHDLRAINVNTNEAVKEKLRICYANLSNTALAIAVRIECKPDGCNLPEDALCVKTTWKCTNASSVYGQAQVKHDTNLSYTQFTMLDGPAPHPDGKERANVHIIGGLLPGITLCNTSSSTTRHYQMGVCDITNPNGNVTVRRVLRPVTARELGYRLPIADLRTVGAELYVNDASTLADTDLVSDSKGKGTIPLVDYLSIVQLPLPNALTKEDLPFVGVLDGTTGKHKAQAKAIQRRAYVADNVMANRPLPPADRLMTEPTIQERLAAMTAARAAAATINNDDDMLPPLLQEDPGSTPQPGQPPLLFNDASGDMDVDAAGSILANLASSRPSVPRLEAPVSRKRVSQDESTGKRVVKKAKKLRGIELEHGMMQSAFDNATTGVACAFIVERVYQLQKAAICAQTVKIIQKYQREKRDLATIPGYLATKATFRPNTPTSAIVSKMYDNGVVTKCRPLVRIARKIIETPVAARGTNATNVVAILNLRKKEFIREWISDVNRAGNKEQRCRAERFVAAAQVAIRAAYNGLQIEPVDNPTAQALIVDALFTTTDDSFINEYISLLAQVPNKTALNVPPFATIERIINKAIEIIPTAMIAVGNGAMALDVAALVAKMEPYMNITDADKQPLNDTDAGTLLQFLHETDATNVSRDTPLSDQPAAAAAAIPSMPDDLTVLSDELEKLMAEHLW